MKLFLILAATLAVAAAGSIEAGLKHKIQKGLLSEAIIELEPVVYKVQQSPALASLKGEAKVDAFNNLLISETLDAQRPYIVKLERLGLKYQTFWANNIIHVKGLTIQTLEELAKMPGAFEIHEEYKVSVLPVEQHSVREMSNITQSNQWGVTQVGAPTAWNKGYNGNGRVVMIIDTGVYQGHSALSAGYAGGAGAWRDPYYNTANPTDQQGHGTHCAGSAVGRNGFGVAPGARWTACRGLDHSGSGGQTQLTTCAQFAVTSSPKPDAVSNSWGGGGGQTWFDSSIATWNSNNIIPVFALGNSGSACRTAGGPGDRPNTIAVGATTNTDAMASFSSRGPASDGRRKPEVSAPGQNIVSCGISSPTSTATMSGTSMACPHVAGAVAVIRQKETGATRTRIMDLLAPTAAKPTLSAGDRGCGLPTPGQDFPNNAFGDGRINVGAAV